MARKVFVHVTAKFDTVGHIQPTSITWEDGRTYEIDKITDVCRASSLKVGGCGTRYTCRISGKETYLFLEENKWFVEAKV